MEGAVFCEKCGKKLVIDLRRPSKPQAAQRASSFPSNRCRSCGHENPIEYRFCEICGVKLSVEAADDFKQYYDEGRQTGKGKRVTRILIPVLMVLIILAGGVYITVNTVFKNKASVSDTSGNTSPEQEQNMIVTEAQTQTQIQAETQLQTETQIHLQQAQTQPEQSQQAQPEQSDQTQSQQTQVQPEQSQQTQTDGQTQLQAQTPIQPQTIHTYEVVLSDASWEEANEAAKTAGGYLATISNAEEQQKIADALSSYPEIHTAWIGGMRTNGSFSWVDGTALTDTGYSNWSEGEPNSDGGNENYLAIYELKELLPYSSVSASSVLQQEGYNYDPSNINDGNLSTAWVEGVQGDGTGEKLELGISPGTVITDMTIWPGYYKSAETYEKNAVPTYIRISSGGKTADFDMSADNLVYEDNSSGYSFSFPDHFVSNGLVTVSILGVRPGTTYADTCISELHLYGRRGNWVWNDVPNDIAEYYSGHMGYVVEFETDI